MHAPFSNRISSYRLRTLHVYVTLRQPWLYGLWLLLSCSLLFSCLLCLPSALVDCHLQPLQKLNNTAFVFTVLFAAGHYMVIIHT